MPRAKRILATVPLKVYLSQENAARLQLATFSPALGKPLHGAASKLVNEALREYFLKPTAPAAQGAPDVQS